MELNDYIEFLNIAEELDKQGRFAESDNLIKLAQFPGFNPQGFGGFGNMAGGGGGNFFTPQMQGAAIGGAVGNALFKSPAGTAVGTLVGSEYGRKQGRDIEQRNLPAELKIQKLKEELIRLQNQNPSNPSKIADLQKKIAEEETILKQTQALRAQSQPQGAQQSGQTQTALPASASLDQTKVYNAVATSKTYQELETAINKFTPGEQALALRFWNLKSQQAAQQAAPAQQQAQAGGLPPVVANILMGMLYDSTLTTPQAIWTKISGDGNIAPELKRAAFDEFIKLRNNAAYGAAQAPAPAPVKSQFTPDEEAKIADIVKRSMGYGSGKKFELPKRQFLADLITKPVYEEIIKRLREKIAILQSMKTK